MIDFKKYIGKYVCVEFWSGEKVEGVITYSNARDRHYYRYTLHGRDGSEILFNVAVSVEMELRDDA